MSRYEVLLPRAGPRSLVDPIRPGGPEAAQPGDKTGVRFEDILSGELGGQVKVSAHAQERLRARGMTLGQAELDRIGQAMDQIARKGGRESLLIDEDAAYVVSVPNRTVITAMTRADLKDNVFTQIDSAVLMSR